MDAMPLWHRITAVIVLLLAVTVAAAQGSEEELKEQADEMFEAGQYAEAMPLYSQLLSLDPTNPEYNYKYGATALYGDASKKDEATKYLRFAAEHPDLPESVHFFLGRAYHLNYLFADAINAYEKYKAEASNRDWDDRRGDLLIKMCKNGQGLLNTIKEIVVLDKTRTNASSFFRSYDLEDIGGRVVVTPEELTSKEDRDEKTKSVIHVPGGQSTIYFASDQGDGTGKDIYRVDVLPGGDFSKPFKVPGEINTEYDENYPFMHPDGETLYFSSKGHNSMGGYDIFMSKYDRSSDTFGEPVNLDFAINTPDDDIFYIADSLNNKAMFASSRSSEQGMLDVYKVKVESFPTELVMIKGTFDSELGEEQPVATITVNDARTNTEVGTYYTDPKSGDYVISVPKSGPYKFVVDAKDSEMVHEGKVEIPRGEGMRAYLQDMTLKTVGTLEKLIINNRFEETYPGDVQALAQQILKNKAQLDVNYDQERMAALENQEDDSGKDVSQAYLDAGYSAGMDNEKVVEQSRERVEKFEKEAERIEEKRNNALAVAEEKLEESREYRQNMDSLLAERQATEDVREQEELLVQAAIERFKMRRSLKRSQNAEQLAETLKKKGSEADSIADENSERVQELEDALASGEYQQVVQAFRAEKQFTDSIDLVNAGVNVDEFIRSRAVATQEEADEALEKARRAREDESNLKSSLRNKRRQQEQKRKPDETLARQIEVLEEDVAEAESRSESYFQKAEELEQLASSYRSQQSIFEGIEAEKITISQVPSGEALKAEVASLGESAKQAPIDDREVQRVLEEREDLVRKYLGDSEMQSEFTAQVAASAAEQEPLADAGRDGRLAQASEEERGQRESEPESEETDGESNKSGSGESQVDGSTKGQDTSQKPPDQEADDPETGTMDEEESDVAQDPPETGQPVDTTTQESPESGKETEAESGASTAEVEEEDSPQVEVPTIDPVTSEAEAEELRATLTADRDWVAILDEQISAAEEKLKTASGDERQSIQDQISEFKRLRAQKLANIEAGEQALAEFEGGDVTADEQLADAGEPTTEEAEQEPVDQDRPVDVPVDTSSTESAEQLADSGQNEESDSAVDDQQPEDESTVEDSLADTSSPTQTKDSDITQQEDRADDVASEPDTTRGTESESKGEKSPFEDGLTQAQREELEAISSDYYAELAEIEHSDASVPAKVLNRMEYNLDLLEDLEREIEKAERRVRRTDENTDKGRAARERLETLQSLDRRKKTEVERDEYIYENPSEWQAITEDPDKEEPPVADTAEDDEEAPSTERSEFISELMPDYESRMDSIRRLPQGSERTAAMVELNEDVLQELEIAIEEQQVEVNEATGQEETEEALAKMNVLEGVKAARESELFADRQELNKVEKEEFRMENAAINELINPTYTTEYLAVQEANLEESEKKNLLASLEQQTAEEIQGHIDSLVTEMDQATDEARRDELQSNIQYWNDIREQKEENANELIAEAGEQVPAEGQKVEPLEIDSLIASGKIDTSGVTSEPVQMPDVTPDLLRSDINPEYLSYKSLNASMASDEIETQSEELKAIQNQLREQSEALRSQDIGEQEQAAIARSMRSNIQKIRTQRLELMNSVIESNEEEIGFMRQTNLDLEQQISDSPQSAEAGDDLNRIDSISTRGKDLIEEADSLRNLAQQETDTEKRYQLAYRASQKQFEGIELLNQANAELEEVGKDLNIAFEETTEELEEQPEQELAEASEKSSPESQESEGPSTMERDSMDVATAAADTSISERDEMLNELVAKPAEFSYPEPAAIADTLKETERAGIKERSDELRRVEVPSANEDRDELMTQYYGDDWEQLQKIDDQKVIELLALEAERDSMQSTIMRQRELSDEYKSQGNEKRQEMERLLKQAANTNDLADRESMLRRARKLRTQSVEDYQKAAVATENAEGLEEQYLPLLDVIATAEEGLNQDQQDRITQIETGNISGALAMKSTSEEVEVPTQAGEEGGEEEESGADDQEVDGEVDETTDEDRQIAEEPVVAAEEEDEKESLFNNFTFSYASGKSKLSKFTKMEGVKADERLDESVFAIAERSYYSTENPIPVNPTMPSGLVFQVQVGAFRNPIEPELFGSFMPLMGEEIGNGITRYKVGLFTEYDVARNARDVIRERGFSDAFVVAYLNGERLSINEIRAILEEGKDQEPVAQQEDAGVQVVPEESGEQESADADYYSDPDAAPADQVEALKGMFYTIQVGVYSKPVSAEALNNVQPLNTERLENGTIRYTTGRYRNLQGAAERKQEVIANGITDAFTTVYYNGERISIDRAREILDRYGEEVLIGE